LPTWREAMRLKPNTWRKLFNIGVWIGRGGLGNRCDGKCNLTVCPLADIASTAVCRPFIKESVADYVERIVQFKSVGSLVRQGFGILLFILFISGSKTCAQGCSDAGFCTIGTLKAEQAGDATTNQKLTLLLPIGVGDEHVFVFTPGIQYDNQLSEQWAVQVRFTANYTNGNLGTAAGLGDLFLAGVYSFKKKKSWTTSITLGTKILMNPGNLKEDGKSLPMQYQSSLGTVDLIAGVSVTNQSLQFSFGWQQPLSGINRNNFLPAYWDIPAASNYPPTNDFKRRGDVLLRIAYALRIKDTFSITPGLLGIYHLDDDTYIDANISNDPLPIDGSRGLTLNATISGYWKMSDRFTLGIVAGSPLVARDVRPDGLTRSIVISPELRWNF
jgi:hypothetical protein